MAAQAVSYYDQAGQVLSCQPEGAASEVTDIIGSRVVKDWCRYIKFKSAYHNCISLLYQGQHCEEQQKMGERCALYQAAADKLEEARKLANGKLSALSNCKLSIILSSQIQNKDLFTKIYHYSWVFAIRNRRSSSLYVRCCGRQKKSSS